MDRWPPKDPQEILDYEIDWGTERLEEAEEIVTSDWAIEDDDETLEILTNSPHQPIVVAHEETGRPNSVTRCWLSGGTLGVQYIVTNTITTTAERTRELSGKLKIKAK